MKTQVINGITYQVLGPDDVIQRNDEIRWSWGSSLANTSIGKKVSQTGLLNVIEIRRKVAPQEYIPATQINPQDLW